MNEGDVYLSKEEMDDYYFEIWLQMTLYSQWKKLLSYCHKLGLKLVGDVPFYVGFDSADVWANQEFFLIDTKTKEPKFIAGVPPDYFSATGQRWGNPMYNWDYLTLKNFSFLTKRLIGNAKLYDVIRLDHFRAFDTYWKIPASCPTAMEGEWVLGPAQKLLDAILAACPDVELIAEDLGMIRKEVTELADAFLIEEDIYCSILPTATQYARNALFAGLMPLAIDKLMPDRWLNDNEEGGKNKYEEDFLMRQLQSLGKRWKTSFDKLIRPEAGRRLIENIQHVYDADFSVIVYNFLDILSHARTETEIIRELSADEAAFRSLTRSWFEHSDLYTILKMLAEQGHRVIITSDHGTIRVDNPIRIVGDRETSPNLRYKTGRNLNYNPKEVFEITRPEEAQLPQGNLTSTYVFATGHDFFSYPNNANKYIRYYKNTFQHGGISMEEMLVPFIVLEPKR